MNWLVCETARFLAMESGRNILSLYILVRRNGHFTNRTRKIVWVIGVLLALRGILVLPMGVKYFTQVFFWGVNGIMAGFFLIGSED